MENPSDNTIHRKAAAAVELALLLPLLLVLFLAAADFARIYRCSQTLADSAHLGAVYLSNPDIAVKTSYETVQTLVTASASDLSPPPTVTSHRGTDADGNYYYEVTLTHEFSPISRAVGAPSTITIKRSAQARMHAAAVAEIES